MAIYVLTSYKISKSYLLPYIRIKNVSYLHHSVDNRQMTTSTEMGVLAGFACFVAAAAGDVAAQGCIVVLLAFFFTFYLAGDIVVQCLQFSLSDF